MAEGGLPAIDDRRPLLISGAALKAFLVDRRKRRRRTCRPGKFYCFSCRDPRAPWGGTADVSFHSAKVVRLAALCSFCETAMHKAAKRSNLTALASIIELHMPALERMNDRFRPGL